MPFPNAVIEILQYYVYRLIDPRNGETFYVGRGLEDRVFQHIAEEAVFKDGEDELTNKLKRIREIRNINGLEVGHVIHRHGMDEATAKVVEAALMDAYPGLSNIQNGADSDDYGAMHVTEIIERYAAEVADFANHRIMLININKSALETSVYEAVRFAWRIDSQRANGAEVILATYHGMIIGAFKTDGEGWIPATAENFPGRETVNGRYGFRGQEAEEKIKNQYVGKQVPEQYRRKGASNPIRYTW